MISLTLDVTIITGMSGAGRSEAAHVLEDLGYFVIDNLPPMLIGKVAELARSTEKPNRYALVVDVRSGDFLHDLSAAIEELRRNGAHTRVLFLDASDEVLVRRYEASRRRHPLSDTDRVSDGIARERALLRAAQRRGRPPRRHVRPQRARAPRPSAGAVRRAGRRRRAAGQRRLVRVQARVAYRRRPRLRLPLPSEPALGRRASAAHRARPVGAATTCSAGRRPQLSSPSSTACSTLTLPGYEREGKAYLSIGVGCTGGRHRSVVVAEQLGERLRGARVPRGRASPRRRPRRLTCRRASSPSGGGHGLCGRAAGDPRVRGRDHRGRERRRRRRELRPVAPRPRRPRARRPPPVPRRAGPRRRAVAGARSSTASGRASSPTTRSATSCSSGSRRRSATSPPRSTRPAACSARSAGCSRPRSGRCR